MYRKEEQLSTAPEEFKLPFEGKLAEENRWANKVNQVMVKRMREATTEPSAENQSESEEVCERKNRGKLIADATCAPADITYPTDLKILNQAREKTEKIIDTLHKSRTNKSERKPRTYRKVARKNYLEVAKQRQPSRKKRRKTIKIGAKLSASCVDEYVFLDRIIWDNFNESADLKAHTSETAIAITFLVMNLEVILRQIFWSLFRFNYFFRVIDYHKLFVNSLTRRKFIYHYYSIS